MLIRLRRCTGWSAPLLFAYGIRHIFAWPGPFIRVHTHQTQPHHIWAAAWQNQQNDQSLRCPHEESLCQLPIERTAKTDQTGQIWVFAGCTDHFVGFVMRRLMFNVLSDRNLSKYWPTRRPTQIWIDCSVFANHMPYSFFSDSPWESHMHVFQCLSLI